MIMTITVTKDDIKNGKACDCTQCAIALAASRLELGHVRVGLSFIRFGTYKRAWLPEKAIAFRKAFDLGYDPEPITFDVEVYDAKFLSIANPAYR